MSISERDFNAVAAANPKKKRREVAERARIEERLRQGGESGEFVPGLGTPEAWALMGMNVFLGLRYVIWGREGDPDFAEIARRANILLTQGIGR